MLPSRTPRLGLSSLLILFSLIFAGPGFAQAQPAGVDAAPAAPSRELLIGTRVAPPFAMKDAAGDWDGLSIDLWRRIAERLGLQYRFQEESLEDLVSKTANGQLDGAIAAMTVTADRGKIVDFTQPFYTTGLGIAVSRESHGTLFGSFSLKHTIVGILGVCGVLVVMGLVVWFIERHENEGLGNHRRGLRSSILWAAMTAAGSSADAKPHSFAGHLITLFWTLSSVVLISGFTAVIASTLTTSQLQGRIQSVSDLRNARTGTVQGLAPQAYLAHEGIASAGFPSLAEALRALESGKIDAVVHDRPILVWAVKNDFPTTLNTLDLTFDRQSYAMALPPNSKLRLGINEVMLDELQSDWWHRSLESTLGDK